MPVFAAQLAVEIFLSLSLPFHFFAFFFRVLQFRMTGLKGNRNTWCFLGVFRIFAHRFFDFFFFKVTLLLGAPRSIGGIINLPELLLRKKCCFC
mmetsp:Transcript_3926/g.6898  ORF Transcript_3926/g.6898 Transcript_3926/m.6898 type:complete len:94 (+) Transcript_3926:487-768(+)